MDGVALGEKLVRSILAAIVDKPDEISVTGAVDERGVLLTVRVAPDDLPRVLGKGGQTINSVRNVTRALGVRTKARYSVIVEEDHA